MELRTGSAAIRFVRFVTKRILTRGRDISLYIRFVPTKPKSNYTEIARTDRRSETKGRSPLLHDPFWDYDKVGGASPMGARGMTGLAAQRILSHRSASFSK